MLLLAIARAPLVETLGRSRSLLCVEASINCLRLRRKKRSGDRWRHIWLSRVIHASRKTAIWSNNIIDSMPQGPPRSSGSADDVRKEPHMLSEIFPAAGSESARWLMAKGETSAARPGTSWDGLICLIIDPSTGLSLDARGRGGDLLTPWKARRPLFGLLRRSRTGATTAEWVRAPAANIA